MQLAGVCGGGLGLTERSGALATARRLTMTECDEIAETLSPAGIVTRADAERAVTAQWGPPSEIGYVIHANVAEALYQRRAKLCT